MKKIIVLFLIVCSTIILGHAQSTTPKKSLNNSVSIGVSYAVFSEEQGFLYSNDIGIGITKRLRIGPEFYYAHTHYTLDSKDGSTQLAGINLNVYFAVIKSKSFKLELGAGYGYRHSEATWVGHYPAIFGQPASETIFRSIDDNNGPVLNINLEKSFHDKFFVGTHFGWQAFGTQGSLWHVGLHTGIKF